MTNYNSEILQSTRLLIIYYIGARSVQVKNKIGNVYYYIKLLFGPCFIAGN